MISWHNSLHALPFLVHLCAIVCVTMMWNLSMYDILITQSMINNSTFSKRCSKMAGAHFLVSIAFKCTPVCVVWSFNILYSVFHLSINKYACINFINIWSLTNSTSEEFTHIWWVSCNGIYRYVIKFKGMQINLIICQ